MFQLYGGKYVPSHGTKVWCPSISSVEQAADLIAQRVFLRKHTYLPDQLVVVLEERLSDYKVEVDDAAYDSGSDDEDVLHYDNVNFLADLKIRRQIVRVEKNLLESRGVPDRWPWQQAGVSQPLRTPILAKHDLQRVRILNDDDTYGPCEGDMEE